MSGNTVSYYVYCEKSKGAISIFRKVRLIKRLRHIHLHVIVVNKKKRCFKQLFKWNNLPS